MEDRQSRLSSPILLARVISTAGHPFVLIPLMVAAATRNWVWTAAVSVGTILPLLAVIVRNVRRGSWSDHDVSRRDQRAGLYAWAIPLLAATAILLFFLEADERMMRGLAAAAVMLGLGVVGNRFLKISMHMMAAAYCAVAIAHIYPRTMPWVLAGTAAIAWSRTRLERHTWAEVAVGTLLGAGAAWWAVAG